jgi:hypothetical protein
MALPDVELWEAVSLSKNREPTDKLRNWLERRADPDERGLSDEALDLLDRLKDCRRAIGWDRPIRPQGHLYEGMTQSVRCRVLLAEVAAFLKLAGYEVPTEMHPDPRQAETSKSERAEERQDRRLRECEAANLKMPDSPLGRLPDGVGRMAEAEGVTRQFYSEDIKAALKRREERRRAGATGNRPR